MANILTNKFINGVFDDINISDYHAAKEYISSSSIKEAMKSLKHFKYYQDNKSSERKSHFDFGNAFEIALMDLMNNTNEFESEVLVFNEDDRPDKKKTFGAKLNSEWKTKILNTHKYIINKDGNESVKTMESMLESCWQDETIQGLLRNTDYQKSLFWTDKETGIKLKTRPDVCKVNKCVVIDIKTCKDASPEGFGKDAANLNYPIQAAIQMRGCIETGLMPVINKYYWIAVEKTAPYNAQIYEFEMGEWDWAFMRLDYILKLIQMAQKDNKWVGYSQQSDNKWGILPIKLPLWYH